MSLSATSTSRLRRQQRLQQSSSPIKQRQSGGNGRHRNRHRSNESGVNNTSLITQEFQSFLSPHAVVTPVNSPNTSFTTSPDAFPSRSTNYDSPRFTSTHLSTYSTISSPSLASDIRSPSTERTSKNSSFLDDDDMPMDEIMGSLKSHSPSAYNDNNKWPTTDRMIGAVSNRPPTGSRNVLYNNENGLQLHNQSHSSDEISSLGEAEEGGGSLNRLANAIRNRFVERPSNLSTDEKALWDIVQSVLASTRAELNSKRRQVEHRYQDVTNKYEKLRHREKKLQKQLQSDGEDKVYRREQGEESNLAFRAIQRVLADVTTERDVLVEKLTNELKQSQSEKEKLLTLKHKMPSMVDEDAETDTILHNTDSSMQELQRNLALIENDRDELRKELDGKNSRLSDTEQALKSALVQINQEAGESKNLVNELEQSKVEIATLQAQHRQLSGDSKTKRTIFGSLKDASQDNVEGVADVEEEMLSLRKELKKKASSLETSKMIIASLEKANGTTTFDLRSKLKEKEEEFCSLQLSHDINKRTLDSLATELRELQCLQGDVDVREMRNIELSARHRGLATILERNVKALRSAAVMHEATGDEQSVDKISSIVSETFTALKNALEHSAELSKGNDGCPGMDTPDLGGAGRTIESESVEGLKHVLGRKTRSINQLEDTLRKRTEETKKFKSEIDRELRKKEEETDRLYSEIHTLKDQCKTNNEILAKKGRELQVLRDSLKVDDGVGYISGDDGSDFDDTVVEIDPVLSNVTLTSSRYGSPQAEAIATLLSQTGNGIETEIEVQKVPSEDEINVLREELQILKEEKDGKTKQLEAEKESLANAKMIISSLEKANKSMMEDLRARLQDSNTAIASLLEKSMEHKQSSSKLRAEVEQVKIQKEDCQLKQNATISKLQDENLTVSKKIEAKEREIGDLRSALAKHGEEIPQITDI